MFFEEYFWFSVRLFLEQKPLREMCFQLYVSLIYLKTLNVTKIIYRTV